MYKKLHIIITLFIFAICNYANAQFNNPKEYTIDARRQGIDYTSEQALPASREFLKIDSTYYVGWLYLGTYMHNKAADFIGYKNAITPLQKAMDLIERNRNKNLFDRSSDISTFLQNLPYQRDYDYIAYCLYQCYCNTDQQEKAWQTIMRFKKRNMFTENYMDSYNMLAWHVHRNRFYTKSKYNFLKNNLKENLAFSHKLLDSQVRKIYIDNSQNSLFVDRTSQLLNGVYHYKSILYSYDLQMDSAQYYYNKLKETLQFPANNYATFCTIAGKFREAEQNYIRASYQESASDKRLHEFIYYKAIIDIYKNNTKNAIANTKNTISINGSTPGFGWYNLALGRSLLYDGDAVGANYYIDKAIQFKEINIGTTLGETHYNFSSSLLKFIALENQIKAKKFSNKYWYFSPSTWFTIVKLYFEKYTLQNLLVSQLANNPERDNVAYKIFSSESTITFDEVWFLIKDFSTDFFIQKFKTELDNNKRPLINKYFKLFLAKLYIKKGHYESASSVINSIVASEPLDQQYEKLFLARLYETTAELEKENDNNKSMQESISQIIYTYPQLLPYTNLQATISLNVTTANKEEKTIINKFKNAKINFSDDAPFIASISFTSQKNEKIITYELKDKKGLVITEKNSFTYTNINEAVRILQLAIFNIGINYKNLNQKGKMEDV